MDSANVFSILQPCCNHGSRKKEDSQVDATAARESFSLLTHTHSHTHMHTHTNTLLQSQMGKGKAVALPT